MPLSPILAASFQSRAALAGLILPTVGLAVLIYAVLRSAQRSRRHAAELARRGKAPPPARRASPWVWVLLGTTVVLVSYLTAGKPPAAPEDEAPPNPVALWASLVAPLAIFLGLVGLMIWSRRRNPLYRAARQANAGDVAGAIATIEARVAARRAAGVASAPGDPAANPYAPPAAAISPAEKRALADDLNALGVFAGMRQDWPEALAKYDEADALVGGSVLLYRSNRGLALVKLGRPAEGLMGLDEALADLMPDDHSDRFQVACQAGEALIDLGRRAEAEVKLDLAAAAYRRVYVIPPWAKKPWKDRLDQLRARLDEAPMPPTAPDPA